MSSVEANYTSGDDYVALHGGTHGSPVSPLLRDSTPTYAGPGSRRAKPGSATMRRPVVEHSEDDR